MFYLPHQSSLSLTGNSELSPLLDLKIVIQSTPPNTAALQTGEKTVVLNKQRKRESYITKNKHIFGTWKSAAIFGGGGRQGGGIGAGGLYLYHTVS